MNVCLLFVQRSKSFRALGGSQVHGASTAEVLRSLERSHLMFYIFIKDPSILKGLKKKSTESCRSRIKWTTYISIWSAVVCFCPGSLLAGLPRRCPDIWGHGQVGELQMASSRYFMGKVKMYTSQPRVWAHWEKSGQLIYFIHNTCRGNITWHNVAKL